MLLKTREKVKFDPSNRAHRQAVKDFLKRNAWGDTEYRFTLEPEYHNLVEMCQSILLDWYISNDLNTQVERKVMKGVLPMARHATLKVVA